MGLKFALKKALIKRAFVKKRKQPFDIESADRYKIDASADETINNSHYLSAHDIEGKTSLYFRFAERGGNADTEIWMVFKTPSGDIYMAESDHIKKDEPLPVEVECIEAGKTIRFIYSGKAKKAVLKDGGYVPSDGESVELHMDALFSATTPAFEFSRHMSADAMAANLAKNKFTKQFRSDMKEMHQIHYEQGGTASGFVKIDTVKYDFEKTPALRDHSYGKRIWSFFNRYIWILSLLENGDFFQTSMIRYPFIRELQAGFYISNNNITCTSFITSMDDIPVTGSVPKEFTYFAEYENGDKKQIDCKLEFNCPFKFQNGEFTVNEGVSQITVNGIKGRGITEFGFSSDKSRWN